MTEEEFKQQAKSAADTHIKSIMCVQAAFAYPQDLFIQGALWARKMLIKDALTVMDEKHWIEPGEIVE